MKILSLHRWTIQVIDFLVKTEIVKGVMGDLLLFSSILSLFIIFTSTYTYTIYDLLHLTQFSP